LAAGEIFASDEKRFDFLGGDGVGAGQHPVVPIQREIRIFSWVVCFQRHNCLHPRSGVNNLRLNSMADAETKAEKMELVATHKFPATQWSVVLEVGGGDLLLADAALERLCANYWHPVYAFVRDRGQSPHDAEDTTQSFFAFLLEKETLKRADRQKGKFRSFLLAALNNFLANQWDKQQVLKRGGGRKIVSLDDTGEAAYIKEPVDRLSPEKSFERHWAMTLVDHVLARLKQEYATGERSKLFAKLEPELTRESSPELYASWAAELGMTEGALQVALHRLRRRFGDLLRSEIAHTVARPEDVDDEIRQLVSAIAG